MSPSGWPRLAAMKPAGCSMRVRAVKLLKGYRGAPAADTEPSRKPLSGYRTLLCSILKLPNSTSTLYWRNPQGQGVTVADCRMILTPPEERAGQSSAALENRQG